MSKVITLCDLNLCKSCLHSKSYSCKDKNCKMFNHNDSEYLICDMGYLSEVNSCICFEKK